MFLAKRTQTSFINGPANLPDKAPRNSADWIVLDIYVLLSFISVDILLAKTFHVFVSCLLVKNNPCGNSSSGIFFLVILNIVPELLFAADFNMFSWLFVSLTLVSLVLWFLLNLLKQT